MKKSTDERIKDIILSIAANAYNSSVKHVTNDMTIDDLGFDSLDMVMMVMEIEETFTIEIPDAMGEAFKTVADIVEYVEKAKGG